MNLEIENVRGQRYDAAFAMAGTKSGCKSVKVIKRKMSFYNLLWVCLESCCWCCYSKFEIIKNVLHSIRDM